MAERIPRGRGGVMPTGLRVAVTLLAAAALVASGAYVAAHIPKGRGGNGTIRVVAAENFWGSLVAQIGGVHASVTSVVTDPNVDPHDYASRVSTARAIASAQLVVVNGAGYDDWALHLIASAGAPDLTVLNVAELVGQSTGTNPHFWYDPLYVNATARQIYEDLVAIDPGNSTYFDAQYRTLQASLAQLYGQVAMIRQQFAGVEVASTESIVAYLANACGLDLVSPPAFMNAVSEGNDPPAQSIVTFQEQIRSGRLAVLVYNLQTATPLTGSITSLASDYRVPVVGVTETLRPANATFQAWMSAELVDIETALRSSRAPGP